MATNLKSTKPSITVVILTKNEEKMIANCVETLRWADEIIVFDTGSSDRTLEIAERLGVKVHHAKGGNFSQWRNEASRLVTTDWLIYIDADERVTPALAKAITSKLHRSEYDAFTLARNNIHYGRWMQAGGWQNDRLLRVFKTKQLKGWQGEVHESAQIVGRIGSIEEPLVHLSHRNLYDGLHKSIEWTDTEARLLFKANHPRVGWLRLIKVVVFDFLKRVVWQSAWKDGQEGMIESMVQSMNRFLVYARLWELQQKPPLETRYDRIEDQIQKLWQEK